MRGEKENPYPNIKRSVLEDWPWSNPSFGFTIDRPFEEIKGIMIDPSQLMADINLDNNIWQAKVMPKD